MPVREKWSTSATVFMKSRGEQLVVDRVTPGDGYVVSRVARRAAHGKDGVHVADFDDAGKLVLVRVYPRG